MFEDSKMEYDEDGCLKQLNEFAQHYNEKLYEEINRLQFLHPHANIIYGDYYNAFLPLYQSPKHFGFTRPLMDICCSYKDANSNETKKCGSPGVIACEDPSQYISWDVHPSPIGPNISSPNMEKPNLCSAIGIASKRNYYWA
ncbi:hypothetical protein PIB30_036977 [Stylosanthes scabra]|uniref:Uncharacterized protein n=1 Tax=Stylosanthes scabra TaxID=79078 RepID=A0ABU6XC11_9FABA|nr:hypothetical protein [Stylosanthes scabra]